jgi:lysozyme family protein
MQLDYVPFIGRVIHSYEGGYGWNKKDPGGPTKYGITCFDLAEHRGQKMDSMARWAPIVQAMTLDEAEDIYRTKYAVQCGFDALPAGPDCCVLDYGINSGIARALASQKAILKGTTIQLYGAEKFVDTMCAERLQFMHAIRGGSAWAEFGKGWGARVADLKAYCDHLTLGGVAPIAPDLTHVVTPKATHVAKTAGAATSISIPATAGAAHAAGLSVPWVCGLALGALVIGVGYEAWQVGSTASANAKVLLPAGA